MSGGESVGSFLLRSRGKENAFCRRLVSFSKLLSPRKMLDDNVGKSDVHYVFHKHNPEDWKETIHCHVSLLCFRVICITHTAPCRIVLLEHSICSCPKTEVFYPHGSQVQDMNHEDRRTIKCRRFYNELGRDIRRVTIIKPLD